MSAPYVVEPETLKRGLEVAGQALFEFDPVNGSLRWADAHAAATFLGCGTTDETDQLSVLLAAMAEEDVISRQTAVDRAAEDDSSYTVEYRLGTPAGEHWVEERGTWMVLGGERKLIAVIRQIDDQKRREERLSYLASYDELTGQLNRARFKEDLDLALAGVRAGTRTAALLQVGIDNVGGINNDFGFDIADQVIVEVASRIGETLGKRGVFGRIAGTKFGVVLHDDQHQSVLTCVREIMNAMRASVVMTRAGGIAVSVCVGATILRPDGQTASTAMAETEAAFDQAKAKGPSSFELFQETGEVTQRRRRNTELSDVILTALNDRRVFLAYQPIVPDVSAAPRKFECLVRMRDEKGSEIGAPAFIPAAERLGLVHLLDRRVLELAVQTLARVPDIELNVNVSWETVRDPVWAEGYLAHLRANRRITDRLTIELTETQMVDAIESSTEFVAAIKLLGCRFAIDDFGAGYTSFRNLKALDIDVLKIDGSFVAGVSSSRDNQLFVRTLLDLARNFQMQTVAEWVDNESDATLLKALGVDFLQGYYIGKPVERPDWSENVTPMRSRA